MSDAELHVTCRVTTVGGWLDLMADPYRLSADAFTDESLTWRRSEVANSFVDVTDRCGCRGVEGGVQSDQFRYRVRCG